MLNGTVYLPGDTMILTVTLLMIFLSSLLCITSNVNIGCCRSTGKPFVWEVEGSGISLMGPGFSPLEIKCLLSSRNSIILKE